MQGWDRTGWEGRAGEIWMRLRDRRGPVTALVLALSYLLLVIFGIGWVLARFGVGEYPPMPANLLLLMQVNGIALAWRVAMRFAITAREYGAREGALAVLRIPVANLVAIMAGRRAVAAYLRTLSGRPLSWDKTAHDRHPAFSQIAGAGA